MKQGKYLIVVPDFITGTRTYLGYHVPRMKRFYRIKDHEEYHVFFVENDTIKRYKEDFDVKNTTVWSKIRSMFNL